MVAKYGSGYDSLQSPNLSLCLFVSDLLVGPNVLGGFSGSPARWAALARG
jgi:hypothetical protein